MRFETPDLNIANTAANRLTLRDILPRPVGSNVTLVSHNRIDLNAPADRPGATRTLATGRTGRVVPSFAGTDVTALSVNIGSGTGLGVTIAGTATADRFDDRSGVDLTGLDLQLGGQLGSGGG